MKNIVTRSVVLLLAILAGGCASPYFADRGRDAADIFTASIGVGAGAKVRVGPLAPGLLANHDVAGLRSGAFFGGCDAFVNHEVNAPFPVTTDLWGSGLAFGWDLFSLEDMSQETERPTESMLIERKKDVRIVNRLPFVAVGSHATDYTQIEAVLALGGSVRLGFNPGELLDFILGWATIDILNDDLESHKDKSKHCTLSAGAAEA